MRLTDIGIKNLPTPEHGQRTYFDDGIPGFGVRVSKSGSRSFVLQIRNPRRFITIGRYGIVSLLKAREKAKDILARKQLGELEKPVSTPYAEALEEFLAGYRRKNKPSTALETERLLRRHFIYKENVQSIETLAVYRRIERISKPGEQQHAFVAARTFFNWAVKRRYIQHSPLAGVEAPHRPIARERALNATEIGKLIGLERTIPIVRIAQLLLITGQRLGQIAHLRREFIDDTAQVITWPAQLMKGNRRHSIPLTAMAADILADLPRDGLLFPTIKGEPYNNWSSSKHKLDELCPLPHWTLHDLRRTFATQLAELGIAPHVIERILAHSTGTISGVAAIYNRYSYLPEMKEALQKWETRLHALLSETESNYGQETIPAVHSA